MALRTVVPIIKKRMLSTDDNCTILCFGATGSGKSSLGFHFGNIYNDEEGVDASMVGFDAVTWADALRAAKDQKGAFLMHDEANISKRDSMSQRNKDLIDLLFTFRAKNWMLWLNNPSADYLDKELVLGDLVNFFIFIHAKQKRYYLFTRKDMQDFYNNHQTLKADVLKKWGQHYARWDGWFLKYSGKDWEDYLERKNQRVDDKLDQYIEKYGQGPRYNGSQAAKVLAISRRTMSNYLSDAVEQGVLSGEQRSPTGVWHLSPQDIENLREMVVASAARKLRPS